MRSLHCLAAFLALGPVSTAARAEDSALIQWLNQLDSRLPKTVADCAAGQLSPFEEATNAVERWAAEVALFRGVERPEQALPRVEDLVGAQQRVDQLLERTLAMRTAFTMVELGERK